MQYTYILAFNIGILSFFKKKFLNFPVYDGYSCLKFISPPPSHSLYSPLLLNPPLLNPSPRSPQPSPLISRDYLDAL